mmetsp:Transcript_72114/g.127843  ORF Transcript_72114/g.127843 Transcript_72114/m.127843 type:complete len:280 (+) Transcript_72114:1-840(+)
MGGMGGMGGMGAGMSLTPPQGAAWGGGAAAGMGGGGMGGAAMGGGGMGALAMAAAATGPSASLFLGDLPGDMTEQTVQTIFGAYGNIVSFKLLQPGTSGKLAAIITFDSVQTASWIVDNLHGNIPQGLSEPIVARYKNQGPKPAAAGGGFDATGGTWGAAPPAAAPAWGGGGGGGKGFGFAGMVDPTQTIFVGDLPIGMDDATLKAVFGAYGTVTSCKILPPGTTGAAALVNFGSAAEAQWCVENLNEQIPQGLSTPIKCRAKTQKPAGMMGGKGWSPY